MKEHEKVEDKEMIRRIIEKEKEIERMEREQRVKQYYCINKLLLCINFIINITSKQKHSELTTIIRKNNRKRQETSC